MYLFQTCWLAKDSEDSAVWIYLPYLYQNCFSYKIKALGRVGANLIRQPQVYMCESLLACDFKWKLKLEGSFIDVMSTFSVIFQAFRRGKLWNLWQNTCEIIFLIHECITWTLIHAVSHVMSWKTFKNLRWNHINIFIFQKCGM